MAVPTPVLAPAVPLLFEVPDRAINVITMQEVRCGMANFNRRDLFKAVLFEAGANELHYATRSFIVDKPALVFTNRLVPYSWEIMADSPEEQGYICTFTEAFLLSAMRGVSLKDSVLYKVDGSPVYFLDEPQLRYLREAFARLRRDLNSDYPHKYELLRHQLAIILHEATRLVPEQPYPVVPATAAQRITSLFLTLLEYQFPITKQLHEPILKTPQGYANRLAVHVNSLNRAVKEVTGKSTSAHLAERFVSEAKYLLQHTDWSVGDIADSLGFEYVTYFNNFFKKHTSNAPLAFRHGNE